MDNRKAGPSVSGALLSMPAFGESDNMWAEPWERRSISAKARVAGQHHFQSKGRGGYQCQGRGRGEVSVPSLRKGTLQVAESVKVAG